MTNLEVKINPTHSPQTWISSILESSKGVSAGIVQQQLVRAQLTRRFKGVNILDHHGYAELKQAEQSGDFSISKSVYHVISVPSRDILRKCANDLKSGILPILLISREQEKKMRFLAKYARIYRKLTIISIENFIAFNIINLAIEETKDHFTILSEIVAIYNSQLSEVETDLSLNIELNR